MHLSDMPIWCYNLLKYYSIILGVPGAAIISKLQSCIPIVVSVCCLLASSRSGAANSSHSRLTKLLIRESNLLQGFSKHRLHAISASWCWRWNSRSSLTFASLTLCVLSLVVIVVLFSLWKTTLAYSHFVFLFVPPVLQSWLTESEQQHCWPSAWLGGGASTELRNHLYDDCISWFMWERRAGSPAGIKIQKTAYSDLFSGACGELNHLFLSFDD